MYMRIQLRHIERNLHLYIDKVRCNTCPDLQPYSQSMFFLHTLLVHTFCIIEESRATLGIRVRLRLKDEDAEKQEEEEKYDTWRRNMFQEEEVVVFK